MAVTGASLTPIYNRLHGIGGYRPGGSDVYADPSLQAGDIVSMSKDGETYATPVMTSRLKWKGSPIVTINTTGNKDRDPVSKMAQRKYSGGGGYRNSSEFSHQFIHNEQELTSIFTKTGINELGEDETLFSRISQTAEGITTEVAAAESRTYTKIRQTKEELEAEIVSAISGDFGPLLADIYASISGIETEVGYKSRVYVQLTDPALTYEVHDGDFWIVDTLKRKFSDFNAGETFSSLNGFRWTDYYGSIINIRKNNRWVESANSRMDALNTTKIEEDREHISLIASKLTETENQYAELKVEASQIRAEVIDAANGFESSLTQTASQIRSEVANTANGMRSSITQTASQIRSEVSAANSLLYASIEQTATQIRSEVVDEINSVRTSITQTASQIRAEVNDDVNSLRTSITATASQIRAEVSDDVNSLRSSITATASQIRSEVRAANSQMHSEIAQTASQIAMKVSYGEVATRLAVECGNVRVSGGDLIVEGMVSASAVESAIAGINQLGVGGLHVEGQSEFYQQATFEDDLQCYESVWASGFIVIDDGSVQRQLKISDISVSGNTMTVTKVDGSTLTFSKAVSLWEWVGRNGKVIVTARPQNQYIGVDVRVQGDASISANGDYTFKVQYEDEHGDWFDTGASKTVNVNVYPGSMSITRAGWHSTSGNVYYGKLYYWDDDDQSYSPVIGSNKYWYYSDSNKSGTTTVHY